MTNTDHYRRLILQRLDELCGRLSTIATELDQPKSKDLNDQAIDLEDDEVLETLGIAAQQEARQLRSALKRLDAGTYGTCIMCAEPISRARLDAVPQTRLCRTCAQDAMR